MIWSDDRDATDWSRDNASVRFWSSDVGRFRRSSGARSFYALRAVAVAEMILACCDGPRVLEIGCGSGDLALALARQGRRVLALDLSEVQVARARDLCQSLAAGSVTFSVGGIEQVAEGECYNAICAIGVFPYVADHPRFIAEIAGRLYSGGLAVVTITRARSLFTLAAVAAHLARPRWSREWRAILANLVRTGIWSGGFVDRLHERQCRDLDALDAAMERFDLARIETRYFHNIIALDRPSPRWERVAGWSARLCGWCIAAAYRKPDTKA